MAKIRYNLLTQPKDIIEPLEVNILPKKRHDNIMPMGFGECLFEPERRKVNLFKKRWDKILTDARGIK